MSSHAPSAAAAVDAGVAWLRPSPDLRRMRLLQVGAVAIPVVAIGGGVGFSTEGAALGGAVTGGLIIVGLLAIALVLRRAKAWRYAERDDDLLVGRGVLIQRLSVVPYGRMQFVDVTAGPFERAFHLSTVRMHTAAAASDPRIPGLTSAEATRLRDRLTALGEAMAAGL